MNFRRDVSGVMVIAEQGQYLRVHSRSRPGDAAGVLLGWRVSLGVDSWLGEEVGLGHGVYRLMFKMVDYNLCKLPFSHRKSISR